MMNRSRAAREDPYLGLLNIRNTPQEGMDTSPAQRLMSRRTRTVVPKASDLLQPQQNQDQKEKLEAKKAKATERFTGRRTLRPLSVGDHVRIQPIDRTNQPWKKAVVTSSVTPRSYEVEADDGTVYRRNRQFLRVTRPTEPQGGHAVTAEPTTGETRSLTPPSQPEVRGAAARETHPPTPPNQPKARVAAADAQSGSCGAPLRTRSGRAVITPVKLNL